MPRTEQSLAVENFGDLYRRDFPIFDDPSLIYLDSAASAQKPRRVIDAVSRFYSHEYSNVHRGLYRLAEEASAKYESIRPKVQSFIGARSEREIIFTRGTTESINLVANTWGRANIHSGDEIVITLLEHHANIVPWQMLAESVGAVLRFVPLNEQEVLDREAFRQSLGPRTKLVALTQLSNALGIALPVKELIAEAHAVGAVAMLDGAQGIVHSPTNVSELDVDFYAFSAHKLYGPTGAGILYGKQSLLEVMPPFLGGGDMIRSVTVEGTTFNDVPHKFEAGTPPIASIVGLGEAIDYLNFLGMDRIHAHEAELTSALEAGLSRIPAVRILGPVGEHRGVVSFVVDGIHPHDIAQVLATRNIAVRAGHHCAQPLVEHLKLGATTRASVGLYNTPSDIQAFLQVLEDGIRLLLRT